jgi:outer membrane protein OmpA-like peptidoglycan-associated protein
MHKMRVVVIINMVLMSSLIFMDTGCKSANGGWRWPWQKDRVMGFGADDAMGPELMADNTMIDIDSVYGEDGAMVSGSRFEDAYNQVQGVAFEPAYFTYDSYVLPPNEIAKVDMVGQHLNANANHVLVIEGHCDEGGSIEDKLSLGENRALALRSYLVNMGISPDRIQTRSFGEEKPAVMGMDESAWGMNRRGEFAFFQK